MSSSSTIDNDECSSRRSGLDARGVSSVTSRARSGLGYRTASPPELYSHMASTRPTYLGLRHITNRVAMTLRRFGSVDKAVERVLAADEMIEGGRFGGQEHGRASAARLAAIPAGESPTPLSIVPL